MTDIQRAFTLLSGKLVRWLQQFILLLPNLLIALVILVATWYLARLVRQLSVRVLPRMSQHATLNNLVSTTAYVGVLLLGVFFTLEVLQLEKTVTSLLAGVGIIGLALGFAFQDIAANFISGVIIAVQRPFIVGDVIETDKFFGTIESINLRTLDLRQVTGELVRVPNRKVVESAVTNYSVTTQRRVDLECGVGYDSDLEQVRDTVLAAMHDFPNLVPGRPVEVMFTGFGDSAITFKLRFWIPYQKQVEYVGAKSEAVMRVKRAFDAAGIVIPFPIRTLDVSPALLDQLSQRLPPPPTPPDQ
ncbi:mechanosensitive ion channel protein MscS [Hymenobacter lapidarius]|uniref:Mechanosensitive ion channel protein MscS n=1 Tax=Hymenobacter lapidarius TaxID=1908237 RepID=A0A1G1STB4_9BACT|nr:mechanosensitive ion channel family protein [Hymenobacter lapidarius]OGX81868.1 mechanosensitive ion channel protein MscS [Hymenobacter lapidarius]